MSVPFTADQLLDGDVPIREESVRFDLLDNANNLLGELAVDRRSEPEIVNDVNRPIRRTLDGITIPPRSLLERDSPRFFADDINPLTMRLRPVWRLQSGDEYPLGIFLWGDDSSSVRTYGQPRDASLTDQCTILDQDLIRNVGLPVGTVVSDAITAFLTTLAITDYTVEASAVQTTAPIGWAAGRDRGMTVLESLHLLAGFLPPYFGNAGSYVARSAPNLSIAPPDFAYGYGTVMLRDSIVESSDILSAPNIYIVIDGSATDDALVGTFEVPASAPHSFANRGFYVPRTLDVQGLQNQQAADNAAAAAYVKDSSTYSWLSFDTPPDPRHDTFNVVAVDGVNYRQQSWRLRCSHGAAMNHDLRGAYS